MQMMQGAGRGPPGAGYGCYDNVVPSKAHGDAPGGDNNNMETDKKIIGPPEHSKKKMSQFQT